MVRLAAVAAVGGLVLGSLGLGPVGSASAVDGICGAQHCYGIGTSNLGGESIYQITGIQSWTCQNVLSFSSDIAVQTHWALDSSRQSWVEFGITTGVMGSTSPPTTAWRDWYVARMVAAEGFYQEFLPVAYRPNRNTGYVTTQRYDGGGWRIFHGNNQILQMTTPSIGSIRYADAGGEINDSRTTETGTSSSLSRLRWGETFSRSGWPNLTKIANGSFTAASTTVTGNTGQTHYNPSATAGCP